MPSSDLLDHQRQALRTFQQISSQRQAIDTHQLEACQTFEASESLLKNTGFHVLLNRAQPQLPAVEAEGNSLQALQRNQTCLKEAAGEVQAAIEAWQTWRRIKRNVQLAIVFAGVSVLFFATILIVAGLKPCGWLDGWLASGSGCMYEIEGPERVQGLRFLANGALLVHSAQGVQLWQIEEDAPHKMSGDSSGHPGTILGVAPTGNLLILATSRGMMWQMTSGAILHEVNIEDRIAGVAFTPRGELAAVLIKRNRIDAVQLWQMGDGKLSKTLDLGSRVSTMTFSPDGRLLALGMEDGSVQLWRLKDGVLVNTLPGSARTVVFSAGGETLATVEGQGDRVRLWRVADGRLIRTLEEHTGKVLDIAFAPNRMILASALNNQSIWLWRTEEGIVWRKLEGHQIWQMFNLDGEWFSDYQIAFSPDGKLLASSTGQGLIRVWRLDL